MALDSPRNANGMHHNHKYHSFCLRSDTMLRQCNGTAISQLSNMHMPEVLQWNTSQDLWHIRPDTEARKSQASISSRPGSAHRVWNAPGWSTRW